jgi:hypothetical protein
MSQNEQSHLSGAQHSMRPDIHSTDMLSTAIQYFRLDRAAELLGYAVSDLLHLGATGSAEIMAPVVLPGLFEWPQGSDGIGFPEIDVPFRAAFGAADRVILSAYDLAKIEGLGWTIPRFFYAPAIARRLVDQSIFLQEAMRTSEKIVHADVGDEGMKRMREHGFYGRWYPSGFQTIVQNEDGELEDVSKYVEPQYAPEIVTKIDHLFISKVELQRLAARLPQDAYAAARGQQDQQMQGVKNLAYLDRHASTRESMWRVAVYCLAKLLRSKIATAELIAQIEVELRVRWPDVDPLTEKQMKAYLSRTLKGDMTNPK